MSGNGYSYYSNVELFRLLSLCLAVHVPCFMGYPRVIRFITGGQCGIIWRADSNGRYVLRFDFLHLKRD